MFTHCFIFEIFILWMQAEFRAPGMDQRRRHSPGDSGGTAGGATGMHPQTYTTLSPASCRPDSQGAPIPGEAIANLGIPGAGKGPAKDVTPLCRLEGHSGRSQEAKDIAFSINLLHGENQSRKIIFLEIVRNIFSTIPSNWWKFIHCTFWMCQGKCLGSLRS